MLRNTSILDDFLVSRHATLKDALNAIDKNAKGVCFIVSDEERLEGILTDGDIRRALLGGATMEDGLEKFMNTHPFTMPATSDNEAILKNLNDHIKVIPLVDDDHHVVDYATINKIRRVPIANPVLDGNELNYVSQCIKTSWISSKGKFVRQFEEMFSDLVGLPNALAVSNGTVALHLALEALGIGKGDEVIVPDLTFAATINAVIYTGATPVLADVDKDTWGLSADTIRTKITSKTKAIIPVHLYGHPCEIYGIQKLAEDNNLLIIEDCAEAIGSRYYDKHVGFHADAATFSFFGNKTITTGEGGMVLFKDNEIAQKAMVMRDHGMSKEKQYWHDILGYNYRMTNVQAAIGVAQMERLPEILQKKRELADQYKAFLDDIPSVGYQGEKAWALNSYWMFSILLDEKSEISKTELMKALSTSGIETRPLFYPLHTMPLYESYCIDTKPVVSEYLSKRGFSLPSSVDLDKEVAHRVAEVIRKNVV